MFEIRAIPHSQVTKEQLDQIIQIKSIAWPYPYEAQQNWIKKNLKESDIHVLLQNEQNESVAYLNLIPIVLKLDGAPISAFGIGNVCALETGKGWGRVLIDKINEFLEINHAIGLLFCKESLVRFYSESHWTVLAPEKLDFKHAMEVKTMMFDSTMQTFKTLEYHGKLF